MNTKDLMKRMTRRVVVMMAVTVVMVVMALGQAIEQKVTFHIDSRVGGETVKKGTWAVMVPEGNQGMVELKVGKKVIRAAFTKQMLDVPATEDKVTYRMEADGSRSVATIVLKGQKFMLTIGENPIARG